MKKFKPDVILGTGGYVAFPTCLAAFFGKRPFYLHESNVLPGFVNRAMCWYARCVFTAFKIPEDKLKERVYAALPLAAAPPALATAHGRGTARAKGSMADCDSLFATLRVTVHVTLHPHSDLDAVHDGWEVCPCSARRTLRVEM